MRFTDLRLRVRALFARRRVEQELDEELAFHIERETQKLIESGVSAAEARTRARARFGSTALAADQCRDARGTAWFDDTGRDLHYAVRSFRRAPLAAMTIVTTVALGLALVAVVFTFFNAFFFRVDAVRNPNELFTVQQAPDARPTGAWIRWTRADYEILRRDTSHLFADAVAIRRGIAARLEGQATNGALVTGNFFQALGVGAALGRTLTPADDQVGGSLVVVLSHRGWMKLFGSDTTVIGRRVLLNGVRTEIVGVAPEAFRGLSLAAPDYWAPLAVVGQLRPPYVAKEETIEVDIIGRLAPGISRETAVAGLSVWGHNRPSNRNIAGGRPVYYRLRPSRGTVGDSAGEAMMVFAPLFFSFGLVLLIGCANVANLLLARGVARQREIGIRLSLGASRRRVVRQLLTESFLLAFMAAAGALALSRVLLDTAIYALLATMRPEIAETINLTVPPADWRVVVFLLAGAVLSTIIFGVIPALHATRLELVRTIRGEVVRDARPARARHVLIGLQVTASALLLICAAVFLRSAYAASSVNPGIRTTDTLMVDIDNETLRPAMLQAIAQHPATAAMAASAPHPLSMPPTTFAEAPATSTRIGVGYRFVSVEYFSVLDVTVLSGRGFTSTEGGAEAGVAVVSESAAKRLWPAGSAIGQLVRLDSLESDRRTGGAPSAQGRPPSTRTFTVVGVARDVRSALQPTQTIAPTVYLPATADTAGVTLTLRVNGDPDHARLALVERLTKVDPALGDVMTMRTAAGLEAYVLRVAFWVTVVLGTLALLLTLSGLFSVLSYMVEQRTKEIGVRIALGASARTVARLVLAQSIVPVGVGLAAGAAFAGALATAVMSSGAASLIGGLVRVYDPLAYAFSGACILIACAAAASIPALRAARIDPIATLRQD